MSLMAEDQRKRREGIAAIYEPACNRHWKSGKQRFPMK